MLKAASSKMFKEETACLQLSPTRVKVSVDSRAVGHNSALVLGIKDHIYSDSVSGSLSGRFLYTNHYRAWWIFLMDLNYRPNPVKLHQLYVLVYMYIINAVLCIALSQMSPFPPPTWLHLVQTLPSSTKVFGPHWKEWTCNNSRNMLVYFATFAL